MQEGVIALMQMAKTVVAFEAMHDAELPVVVVLVHPTTGGVWASFASLGDVTYAEPGALIAFSGPRVIEQTTREKLGPRIRPRRDADCQRAGRRGGRPPRAPGRAIGNVLAILDRPIGARAAAGGDVGAAARRARGRTRRAGPARRLSAARVSGCSAPRRRRP